MIAEDILSTALAGGTPPIVAILRGLDPTKAEAVGNAIVDAGISIVEVPLNSPEPLKSIEIMAKALAGRAIVGAGTVLTTEDVENVVAVGGQLIISPNCNPEVVARSLAAGVVPMPGFQTPTEAFAALAAGARHLKLFPAKVLGIAHLRALQDVLPADASLWAVGGAGADDLAKWLAAGALGIGVGSALFTPEAGVGDVAMRARALVAAWRDAQTA